MSEHETPRLASLHESWQTALKEKTAREAEESRESQAKAQADYERRQQYDSDCREVATDLFIHMAHLGVNDVSKAADVARALVSIVFNVRNHEIDIQIKENKV